MSEENKEIQNEVASWPLWRIALKTLKELPNFGFGFQIEAKWFEKQLDEKIETSEFAFNMMQIAQNLEIETGYVLQRRTVLETESGLTKVVYQIPSGEDHTFIVGPYHDEKGMNHIRRGLHIRRKTLANPAAGLNEEQKKRVDKDMEISAQRLLFMQRQTECVKVLRSSAPKLLKPGNLEEPKPSIQESPEQT